MFIRNKERIGTGYIEIQYCEKEPYVKNKELKLNINKITHFKDTSLFISDDDIEEFLEIYMKYFEPTISPDGSSRFCYYGLNYYIKEITEEILKMITEENPKYSEI